MPVKWVRSCRVEEDAGTGGLRLEDEEGDLRSADDEGAGIVVKGLDGVCSIRCSFFERFDEPGHDIFRSFEVFALGF